MIDALITGVATGLLWMLLAGLRRIPWRYAVIMGLGAGVVFSALRQVTIDLDAGLGVLLGAIGGSVVQLGFDRGQRERERQTAEILGSSQSSIG
jgi:hypothetical protein